MRGKVFVVSGVTTWKWVGLLLLLLCSTPFHFRNARHSCFWFTLFLFSEGVGRKLSTLRPPEEN